MKRVMDGIRVVEVANWTYVPIAGAVLAEWGADVIKIEHPESGDPQRGLATSGLLPGAGGVNFMMELPNRGKRSVGLDIKHERGYQLLLDLVKSADVFLTNMRPDARRRLRIDVDDLRAVNPNLVYVRGSAHGPRGPEAERTGYDGCTFWARGGSAYVISEPGDYPIGQAGPAYGDVMGGMTIAGGISAALLHRERTGEALVVDSSLYAMGMWAVGATVLMSGLFGLDRITLRGNRGKVPNPLVQTYRTKDDRHITLVMLESDRYWPDFVTKAGRPDLVDDPRFSDQAARAQNSEACVAVLDEVFAGRTFEEWKEILLEVEGAWGAVQKPSEMLEDPQALANGYVQPVTARSGTTFRMVPSPIQFDEEPPELTRGPDHGEHTDGVLQELGLDMDTIVELKIAGAIL